MSSQASRGKLARLNREWKRAHGNSAELFGAHALVRKLGSLDAAIAQLAAMPDSEPEVPMYCKTQPTFSDD